MGIALGALALVVAIGGIVLTWLLYKKALRETDKKFENQESHINALARKIFDKEPQNAEMVKDPVTGDYHLAFSRSIPPQTVKSSEVIVGVKNAHLQNANRNDEQASQ